MRQPYAASLLQPQEMYEADRLSIKGGMSGSALMQAAGRAVADVCVGRFPQAHHIAVLAGSGNNGGDAFVVAAMLVAEGLSVTVFSLGGAAIGDAAIAERQWTGVTDPLVAFDPTRFDLIVDGLLGAGLSRNTEGPIAEAIRRTNKASACVVAIDLPSGISGQSGACLGEAIAADVTVTFFRRKPGHLLQPGRQHCGETIVADIGIPPSVLDRIQPTIFANEPSLWSDELHWPDEVGHKYDRGHAVVFSGQATQTGASRMSALAAQRSGAGLVTVFSPSAALLVNAAHLTGVMLKRCDNSAQLADLLQDKRFNAFVLGPGFGIGEKARDFVVQIASAGRRMVLDADGITSFSADPASLFDAIKDAGSEMVLTPHAGEFQRLFPAIHTKSELSKVDKAREAAVQSNATIVLKGSDTVIASPDGRVAINAVGTPWLATAGTGDVLTGLIAGQLAQGVPTFEAACAGVWMHGRAGERLGPGLIAEDLPGQIPDVLRELAS